MGVLSVSALRFSGWVCIVCGFLLVVCIVLHGVFGWCVVLLFDLCCFWV